MKKEKIGIIIKLIITILTAIATALGVNSCNTAKHDLPQHHLGTHNVAAMPLGENPRNPCLKESAQKSFPSLKESAQKSFPCLKNSAQKKHSVPKIEYQPYFV